VLVFAVLAGKMGIGPPLLSRGALGRDGFLIAHLLFSFSLFIVYCFMMSSFFSDQVPNDSKLRTFWNRMRKRRKEGEMREGKG